MGFSRVELEEDEAAAGDQRKAFMAAATGRSATSNTSGAGSDDHHQNIINHTNYNYPLIMHSSSNIQPPNFISKESTTAAAYDLGELDQALFLYLDHDHDHDHHQGQDPASTVQQQRPESSTNSGMRPPTLNIFPSQPMHVVDPAAAATISTKQASTGLGSSPAASSTGPKRPASMELANDSNDVPPPPEPSSKPLKREGNRKSAAPTSSSEQEGPKTPDPKTLRRLAQNREAARKSRLRKKAYVQQLESSRIKLTQLEQELHRARSQGVFMGPGVMGGEQGLMPMGMAGNITSEAAVFDMEYARWLEEHHRLLCELRGAVQEHLPENELRMFVSNCLAHYDEMMNLKSMVAKTDVFHLVSGVWKTPAERCFMWLGGFRPSELIKVIISQIEPLTEQQIMGICGVQQATQEAEESLSQGLEALNQSVSDIIASDSLSSPAPNMPNYMAQMAIAINKLSTLQAFVRQADNLRHQTIHRLQQILTIRQGARCLLAMAEYFHRLRALSSLWLARPRLQQDQ